MNYDLTELYSLFASGFMYGALFSAIPFLLGQIINIFFGSVKSA